MSGRVEAGSVELSASGSPPPEPGEEGLCEIVLHGHRVFYRSAGSGPVLVLIHGITSTSATWAYVLPSLAEHFTVIAPDLIGHGESAKPRGDYSLGAYAAGIRDLLIAFGAPSGLRLSGIPWAAAWRCNFPICSRSTASGWCS